MDRLASMTVFASVAEESGFSAAARRLRMPLATVSRKVSELEAHLGVRLLNRSTRRVVLTESGRAFHQSCRRILAELEEAEQAVAGEYVSPRGELVVTAPNVFGRLHVVPVVTAFLAAYPDIDVNLMLSDRILSLLDEHVDVAIRIGELPDSTITAVRLGAVRRVTCAAPAYLAGRKLPVHPADLALHDCVVYDQVAAGFDEWTYRVGGRDVRYPIKPRLVVTSADAAIAAASAGAGITRVLSYQIVDAVRQGELVRLLDDFVPPALPVHLVYGADRRMARKLRAFIDFTTPRLRAALATA